MLTDSSLTNILIVSGVSQIRYRAYCQHCSRSSLINYLRNTFENGDKEITLLKAYSDLIALNIPALWRISSESTEPGNDFVLELWVFWFDERHTGKIDANDYLDALEEIKVGSFTWENAYSKIQSPTASPVPPSTQSTSSLPVTVSEEYKWFIKSIRNLIQAEMKSKDAIPLGDFYLFPNQSRNAVEESKSNLSNMDSSILCCSYNIYLASTNLIFQPCTRRIRLEPISLQTIQTRGKKVIISPSGETVQIATNKNYTLPVQVEESILQKWSALLDIPYNKLLQSNEITQCHTKTNEAIQQNILPNLVAIRSSTVEEAFYYPTRLIFVSNSSRLSPTAIAGMNGLFAYNQGFSEDLGDKWNRWAWSERISNYWEYVCTRESTAAVVLDSLSHDTGTITTNGTLLQRAINEPVTASPLMAAKSVATPGSAARKDISTPSSGSAQIYDDDMTQDHQSMPSNQHYQRHKARYQSDLSLIDFAMSNFALPNNTEDLVEYPIMNVHDPSQHHLQQQVQQTPYQSHDNNLYPSNDVKTLQNNTPMDIVNTGNKSTYQSPHMSNLELEAFGIVESMDVDNMVLDIPNRWGDDGMGDLDNFDFGVTEEDFDFFETSGPVASIPANSATVLSVPMTSMDNSNNGLINEDPNAILHKQEDFDVNLFDDQQKVLMDLDEKLVLDNNQDISVTPLQVGMDQHEPFDMETFDPNSEQSFQQADKFIAMQPFDDVQQQLFVPPEFAPVKISSMVNDTKYINGGKFTYIPELYKTKKKNTEYRPDYIPNLKNTSRRKSSKLLKQPKEEVSNFRIEPQDDSDNINDKKPNSDGMSEDSDDDSIYSSSSSGSSYENDSEDDANKAARTMKALLQAQDNYIQQLIDQPTSYKKAAMLNQVIMDYDSPFARTVASGFIRLPHVTFNFDDHEETVALDYLCQQAVMGGYPFSSGIECMSSNGFEANEGESSKVIVARRRNLLQKFNGDAIHIPSIPNDVEHMTQRFKNALSEIFSQPKKTTENMDDMCIDSLPLPASVSVKGPLNVQQYYDLSETNQAHSKYGKYQVKKRRPAEPNLDTLLPPNITVSRQDDNMEGTSKLIMFWEKLRLEPYSNKKPINYFVIFPKNESIENHVSQFFKGLSTVYETCQLGQHHPGSVGPYRRGLVPVPLLPGRNGESFEERQLRSYSAVCQSLGSEIGGKLQENVHIVIYIVNPASHLSSNLELSRCFAKLMASYHETAKSLGVKAMDKSRARVVLQLMPIEHLLRSTTFGGSLKFGLKDIAFSVYSKCHIIASRQHARIANSKEDTNSVTTLYAPPFVLSKPTSDQIHFSLKKALTTFPTIMENQAVLHMGYSFSLDSRWMIIVWTDNCGELVEFAILDIQEKNTSLITVFEDAWKRTKKISKKTGFTWTFVIAKLGLMFEEELKAWISLLPAEEQVAIVSIDTESTLNVSSSNTSDPRMMNDLSNPLNPDSLGTSTPNMMNTGGASTPPGNKKVFTEGSNQTKALLLNHRVAYSKKRERMSYGILRMDSASTEDWMIPLASGYIIHTSPSTENPNSELFNCSPLILEIHLIYNQTNHSAYSTLRDIIKKYYALSYVNVMPSNSNCFPIHLLLVERLSRILLVTNP